MRACIKKGSFIAKWGRQIGATAVQNGVANLLSSGSIVIAKWGGYY